MFQYKKLSELFIFYHSSPAPNVIFCKVLSELTSNLGDIHDKLTVDFGSRDTWVTELLCAPLQFIVFTFGLQNN